MQDMLRRFQNFAIALTLLYLGLVGEEIYTIVDLIRSVRPLLH
jgi:hypothetical protein